jgi:hypothetical protein
MLLPRFTLRTLLAILTGAAILSLFAGQAYGGRAWALGLTVAVLSVPVALVVHGALFSLAMLFGRWLGAQEVVARTSRGGVERTAAAAASSAVSSSSQTQSTP